MSAHEQLKAIQGGLGNMFGGAANIPPGVPIPSMAGSGMEQGGWNQGAGMGGPPRSNAQDLQPGDPIPEDLLQAAAADPEFMKLLQQYQAMGGSMDPDKCPPELNELLKNVQKAKGGTPADNQTVSEDITPEAFFVIKTANDTGRKVFLNVCGSPKIPAPGTGWKGNKVPEEVENALKQIDDAAAEGGDVGPGAEALRFPLSCGDLRNDHDKKGEPCSVCDVIFNSDVVKQAQGFKKLKVFLVELAISWVGSKHKTELDARFKLPHIKYKGDKGPQVQRVRVDPKALIEEVDIDEEDDEVHFPLVTKPLPAGPAHVPGPPPDWRDPAAPPTPGPASSSGPGTAPSTPAEGSSGATSFSFGKRKLPEMETSVRYEGKPAEWAVVQVQLPEGSFVEIEANQVEVAVVRECVEVEVAGYAPATVTLPFAVDAEEADCELQKEEGLITVKLPYKPYAAVVDEARAAAPHSFGSLQLSSAALDLEELE